MENTNEMQVIFDSRSSNEAFARVTVAAFMTSLNPTVEEVSDVKTAVSEAVTNAIIHGYEMRYIALRSAVKRKGKLYMWRSKIREKASKMCSRPWSLCLRRSRIWTGRHGIFFYGSLHGPAGGDF